MDKGLATLAAFHITGERLADDLDDVGQLDLRPALFGAYRDLHSLRYDYPLVLVNGDAGGGFVRSLSAIFDDVLREIAPRGIAGERLRQQVLKLEAEARALAAYNGTRSLSRILDEADRQLQTRANAAAQDQLRDSLSRTRDCLRFDGDVVECDQELPVKLVTHAWTIKQRERAQVLRDRFDALILKLSDILKVDFMHSEQAHDPESLKRSMGSGYEAEFDFNMMSQLLRAAPVGEPLPDARRRRIRSALSVLKSQRFVAPAPEDRKRGRRKALHSFAFDSCEQALEAFQERLPEMARLVKAMAVAELEIDNRYNESKHDPIFRRFAHRHLRGEDIARFPSYLVCLRDGNEVAAQHTALWQVFSAELPIKVLVQFDDILGEGQLIPGIKGPQLAAMAIGLGHVYVLQSSSASLYQVRDALERGLAGDGPALFSVFSGSPHNGAAANKNSPGIAPYLTAAAAVESRAFPGYTYDPQAGTDWAARFHLDANPQRTADWPIHSFTYADASLQNNTRDSAFTFVDFAACDERYAHRLARVPQTSWHDGMVPVNEFLVLDAEVAITKVPYIWMIDEHDGLHRVIVEDSLIDSARQCRDMWRRLQELAGINNSHARALLAREREIWQVEKEQELEALRSRPDAAAEASPRETAADSIQETVTTEPEAADDAGEKAPVDEPYIETLRCTTCNECTELNNKMFAYNDEMQACIADIEAGTFRQLVEAAETCQVAIIHPGKPKNPDEPGLSELQARAAEFN